MYVKILNSRNYFQEVCGFIFLIDCIVLYGFMSSYVTQKPKYSILVCPKKDFSILN